MPFGIVALSAMVFSPLFNTFAGIGTSLSYRNGDDDGELQEVRSSKLKGNGCETHNNFKTSDDVNAKGEHFTPHDTVDIYVTQNKKWQMGDLIGSDVSSNGVDTVVTDLEGKIPCGQIWENQLTKGRYDIVVDANQDGTYNSGDAIDGKSNNAGFRAK